MNESYSTRITNKFVATMQNPDAPTKDRELAASLLDWIASEIAAITSEGDDKWAAEQILYFNAKCVWDGHSKLSTVTDKDGVTRVVAVGLESNEHDSTAPGYIRVSSQATTKVSPQQGGSDA